MSFQEACNKYKREVCSYCKNINSESCKICQSGDTVRCEHYQKDKSKFEKYQNRKKENI